MHIFLFIFFFFLCTAGLIFKVDMGVFVGLCLTPWELIKIGVPQKLMLFLIIIAAGIGSVFFIYRGQWLLTGLFLLIQLYNIWGYYRKYKLHKKLDK